MNYQVASNGELFEFRIWYFAFDFYFSNCLVGTASAGLGDCVGSAIKAQHRLTEEDRFPGLPTEGGRPGGGKLPSGHNPLTRRDLSASNEPKRSRSIIQTNTINPHQTHHNNPADPSDQTLPCIVWICLNQTPVQTMIEPLLPAVINPC